MMMERNKHMKVEEISGIKKPAMLEKVILTVAFGGWLLFCALFYNQISDGFFAIWNDLLKCRAIATGTIQIPYEIQDDHGIWFLVPAVIWLLSVLFYCLVKRSRKSWRYFWTKAVTLAACSLFALLLIFGSNLGTHHLVAGGYEAIREKIQDVRYGTNEEAGLFRGDLYKATQYGVTRNSNLQKWNYQEEDQENIAMLDVVMEQPESMYFRGFVGECYEDGKWTLLDSSEKVEDSDLFYWLHQSGFYGQTQLGTFVRKQKETLGDDTSKTTLLSVKNIGADKRYLYAPYELTASGYVRQDLIGDLNLTARSRSTSEICQFQIQSKSRMEYASLLEEQDSSKEELHYREWVYRQYLTVPEAFSKQFLSVLEQEPVQSGEVSVAEAKQAILQYLTDGFQYEEQLQLTLQEDPLLYFMQQSGKGYDVHYASVATLMFRYLGIPARYVEGFLVTEQMASDAGASSVIHLSDEDSHAWTEIYVDGAGWVPFEATPVYRNLVKEAEVIPVEVPGDASSDTLQTPPNEEEEEPSEGENNGILADAINQEEDTGRFGKQLFFISIIVILLFAIGSIVAIVYHIRKKRTLLQAGFELNKRSAACQNIFAHIMVLLKKKGLQWQPGGLEENIDQIARLFSGEYAKEFRNVWFLHEQIRFGKEEPSEEAYEQLRTFMERTKKKRRADLN